MKLMIDMDGIIYLTKGTTEIKQICPYNKKQYITGNGSIIGCNKYIGGHQEQTTNYVDILCNQSCPKCHEPLPLSDGKYSFKVCDEEYIIDEFIDNREKCKCFKCGKYILIDSIKTVGSGWDTGKRVCESCHYIYYRRIK